MFIEDPAKLLNESFDKSGLIFRDRAASLAEFKRDREIVTSDDDGQLYTRYDGEVLPLDEALLRFGLDNREQIDGRSAPQPPTKDKMTQREKIGYISQHGADAYAKLKSHAVVTTEVTTRQQFMALPRAEKVARYAANPNAFVDLPNATGDQMKGSFINHQALKKIEAIRPASRKR